MATMPCPNKIDCPGIDFPISNYTSEGDDCFLYTAVVDFFGQPSLRSNLTRFPWCLGACETCESQEAADRCAKKAAQLCTAEGDNTGYECNDEVTISSGCPDGALFYFTVAAGQFCAPTKAEANALAEAEARQHNLLTYAYCMDVGAKLCAGVACGYEPGMAVPQHLKLFYAEETTGYGPYSIEVIGGEVPTGMVIMATPDDPFSWDLIGNPTTPGTYNFTLKVTDVLGNFLIKQATVSVVGVTTGTALPDGTAGTAYVQVLQAAGGSGNYSWTVKDGTSLPPGLTMGTDGIIQGTPTTQGTYNFSVECEAL